MLRQTLSSVIFFKYFCGMNVEERQIKMSQMGVEFEPIDEKTIKVTQKRVTNGYILNRKELLAYGKDLFPKAKIIADVYEIPTEQITPDWVKTQMDELGIRRVDIIKHLNIGSSLASLYLTGKRPIKNNIRHALFFYFLTFRINRGLSMDLIQ